MRLNLYDGFLVGRLISDTVSRLFFFSASVSICSNQHSTMFYLSKCFLGTEPLIHIYLMDTVEEQRVVHQICDWAKHQNRHSSKSIQVIQLSFCQNDPSKGEFFWQKDSLTTLILFELCLFMIFSPVANLMHHPLSVLELYSLLE